MTAAQDDRGLRESFSRDASGLTMVPESVARPKSVDEAIDLRDDLIGVTGMLITLIAGAGGAALLLVAFWRPPPKQP